GTEDYVYKVDKTLTPEECEGNLPPPEDVIEITSCREINESGNYILANNIIASSGDCIIINADNVVLDCLNRKIEGSNGGEVAINVFSYGNIIRNCHIENFEFDGIKIDCVSKHNLIENNSVSHIDHRAIFLDKFDVSTTNNIIKDNILRDSEFGLLNYGLFTIIEDNEICQNTLDIDSGVGSFTGNNNLCDTTKDYHDESVGEGCENPCPGTSTSSSIDIPQIGETFQLSFYGQDIEDGRGLVIITGQPIQRTIAQRVFHGDEIDITPQLSGPLVTRLISLDPVRISRLVQKVQEI
ncbi:MAG: hypothetical protein GF368_02490, partial [Candidatus Aenigmarchaeota archaeon]|nr:hypothetical protein [Candidatus Aenigmarchaeota archaeon]